MEAHEILQDPFFVLLYGGVMMFSFVAALYLLLRRGNAIAPEVTSPVRLRRWAAVYMLTIVLSHFFWLLYVLHPAPAFYVLVCGLDMLMLFPSIAGVLLSMLQDRRRPLWPVLVSMAPIVVLLILCLVRADEVLLLPLAIYVYALYALLMLYAFFAVRRYGRWLRDNYVDLENKEVWLSFLLLALFLLFFVMYSNTSEESGVLVYLLQINNILIAGLLLWRVDTLPQLNECGSSQMDESLQASAPQALPSDIATLLKKHCESKHLYLEHDLTLAQLAQAIGTNHYYLSQHFAQQGLTYNAYIGGLRIRHFIRLYHKAVADQRIFTAQQLAFESGFHSYSTFSATFKQNMGTAVTAWMRDAEK